MTLRSDLLNALNAAHSLVTDTTAGGGVTLAAPLVPVLDAIDNAIQVVQQEVNW